MVFALALAAFAGGRGDLGSLDMADLLGTCWHPVYGLGWVMLGGLLLVRQGEVRADVS
jgi:hypothetical protein